MCSHPFCSTTLQPPKTPSQKCKQGSKKEKKNAGRGHTCGRTRPSHLRPKQEALVIVPWLDRAKDEARARAGSLARRQNPRRLPPVLSPFPPRWHSAGIRFRLIPPFSSNPRVASLFVTTYITFLLSGFVFKVTFSWAGIIQVINKITNPALFPLLKRWTNVAWLFEIFLNHQGLISGFHEKINNELAISCSIIWFS